MSDAMGRLAGVPGYASLFRLCGGKTNLFNWVPSEVRAGFVFGADIPRSPWDIVATGRGDLGDVATLS